MLQELLGSYCVDPVQFRFEEFVRGFVTMDPSRQAVAPDFDLTDLLVSIAVNTLAFSDESADQTIVPLHRTLLTRRVRMRKVDQCFAQIFQPSQ